MTSTSVFKTEEVREAATPDENVMLERKGFQTRGFRRELGPDLLPVNNIGSGVRELERGNAMYADAEGDFPLAPTAIGETGGAVGIEETRGTKFELYRAAHHLGVNIEDREVNADQMSEKVRQIMELFDIQMDKWVFDGITDENGNTKRNDIFSELKTGIPSGRTIDCSGLSLSNDLNGVEANVFRQEAYSKMEGHYFNDSWAALVAKHPVHALFNKLDTADGAAIFTHWDVSSGEMVADEPGLIDRKIRVPEYIGLQSSNSNAGNLSFSIDSLGDDEALLIPAHGGDFMEMWEQGTPDDRGPIEKEGWREVFEYKMWGGHAFDVTAGAEAPRDDSGNRFPDAIHLTSVSSLF